MILLRKPKYKSQIGEHICNIQNWKRINIQSKQRRELTLIETRRPKSQDEKEVKGGKAL